MAKTQKQIIGNLGEGIACNYLKNEGFNIIERNYWKPWGEIDIIAQKGAILHFVEVKSVSSVLKTEDTAEGRGTNAELCGNDDNNNVIRETQNNVSYETLQRLKIWLFGFFNVKNVICETVPFVVETKGTAEGRGNDAELRGNNDNGDVIRETILCGTNTEIYGNNDEIGTNVIRETNLKKIRRIRDRYRPEDNLHPWKLKRLSRVLQSYLLNKNISEDQEWKFDVITVYLDIPNKT
ncbi:YraN family protein, partial [Candidatus Parcubacteria bacterium]|nr:YraN family protein [Candidatus Parcubacteria bacterium]